jgi:hypothetical protein
MFSRRNTLLATLVVTTMFFSPMSWSYGGGGGGGGGSSCAEPKFFPGSPGDGATVASLQEFTFVASDSEPDSVVVKVDGQPVPAQATPMKNGDLQVAVKLAAPVTKPGKLRITIDAKSKDGCFGFKPYSIEIKP